MNDKKRLCLFDALIQYHIEYSPLNERTYKEWIQNLKNAHMGKEITLATICKEPLKGSLEDKVDAIVEALDTALLQRAKDWEQIQDLQTRVIELESDTDDDDAPVNVNEMMQDLD